MIEHLLFHQTRLGAAASSKRHLRVRWPPARLHPQPPRPRHNVRAVKPTVHLNGPVWVYFCALHLVSSSRAHVVMHCSPLQRSYPEFPPCRQYPSPSRLATTTQRVGGPEDFAKPTQKPV